MTTEKILQDCVDELFALQEKTEKSSQQFLQEITIQLKKNHQLLIDTERAAASARASAEQSQYSAEHALEQAVAYATKATFWKRFAMFTGAGYFTFGIILACWVRFNGFQFAKQSQSMEAASPYKNIRPQSG